jgi:hypothetical protein
MRTIITLAWSELMDSLRGIICLESHTTLISNGTLTSLVLAKPRSSCHQIVELGMILELEAMFFERCANDNLWSALCVLLGNTKTPPSTSAGAVQETASRRWPARLSQPARAMRVTVEQTALPAQLALLVRTKSTLDLRIARPVPATRTA